MVGLGQKESPDVGGMIKKERRIVKEIKLTRNFYLRELLTSSTAVRLGIDNTQISKEVLDNLTALTTKVLQPLRDSFDMAVTVNSAFRCLELNRELGSEDTSQHTLGKAADIEIYGIDNYELAGWISRNLEFDQLILEFYDGTTNSGWVHVSYSEGNNRGECLTINKGQIKRGLKR